jgi:hypothetical protein
MTRSARSTFAVGLVVSMVLGLTLTATHAGAHRIDKIRAGRRLGPVRFGHTSIKEAKGWFGQPTNRKPVQLGCIKAVKVRWGERLVVYFTKTTPHVAVEGTVFKRVFRSKEHGRLRMHTSKGLRVSDGNERLRNLYPKKKPFRHRGHFDWFLVSSPSKGRTVALTRYKRSRVRGIFAGPYETC